MAKGMGGMGDILKQAQKMQQRLLEVQQELKQRVVEGSAGGGMVRVAVNGEQQVLSVKVDPQAVSPEDVELLEDMVLAAVNQALEKARQMAQEEMAKVTGGLQLPGFP
jgi:DNA-binding YbaB/EbfC family protein